MHDFTSSENQFQTNKSSPEVTKSTLLNRLMNGHCHILITNDSRTQNRIKNTHSTNSASRECYTNEDNRISSISILTTKRILDASSGEKIPIRILTKSPLPILSITERPTESNSPKVCCSGNVLRFTTATHRTSPTKYLSLTQTSQDESSSTLAVVLGLSAGVG